MIVQVSFESRLWDWPIPAYGSLCDRSCNGLVLPKVADLVQLGTVPDGKRDYVCSKVQEIDCIQSVLWTIEHTSFTYTLVRIASALHPLSGRTDGYGDDII